jgi:DHA1 family bicyclomycin/chloramphenicol resistance-like MFS transporter
VSSRPAIQSRGAYIALATLLAGLSMISPFSIDTFFPSFRAMEQDLGVSRWQMQQTLTAYLLPYAFTVLLHGPLSDALGRRPVVIGGMVLYTLGSLACVFAPDYWSLLAFRAVQGATAGAGMVVGRAIVRDLYDGPRAQRLMSLVSLIFGAAPAIAPVMGGWIHVSLGWRAVFGFLTLLGVLLLAASVWRLPETHPRERRVAFAVRPIARAGWMILRDGVFMRLALAAGLNFLGVFCFIAAAPAVVLDHWRLTETQFIWLFVPIIGGFTLGAVVSGRLAGRLPLEGQIRIGFTILGLACVARALTHTVLENVPIPWQQAFLFASALGTQLVFSVLTLKMLDLFPDLRGSASSMQSFVSLLLSSVMIGVLAPLAQSSLLWLSLGSVVAIAVALALWRSARAGAG